jgi:FMN-dependent NADH-azoreductase
MLAAAPMLRVLARKAALKHIFGFIGFTDIREIFIEPTEASPASKAEAVSAAGHKAAEMAAHF